MDYLEERARVVAAANWLLGLGFGTILGFVVHWTAYAPAYGPLYLYLGAVIGGAAGFLAASSLNIFFGGLLYIFGREPRSRSSRIILAFSFGASLLGAVLGLASMARMYHGGSGVSQSSSPGVNGSILLHDAVVPTIWLALNLAGLASFWRRAPR